MADLEQQIKQAQNNPLYHTVYDITKNIDNIEGAREAIKQFGIDNNLDVSQLSEFFNNNEFAFFNGDIKVPNMNSFSNVQFGLQSKVAKTEQVGFDLDGAGEMPDINEPEQLSMNEYLDNFDAKQKRKQEKKERRQKAQEAKAQEEAVKQTQWKKQAEKKAKSNTQSKSNKKKSTYQSKNMGGWKQRRTTQTQTQNQSNPNVDYKIEEFNRTHADNTRKAAEQMYGDMFDQIEATDKNQARARVFKEAAAKGNEQIATNNVIDSIFPLIEDASDLETAQSKIAEWAKKSGLDKENRMEMRSFLHDNWEDISKKQKAKIVEKQGVKKAAQEGIEELGESNLKKIFNKRVIGTGFNAVWAISDYKDAREEGKGVVGSVAKAGIMFATGEVLGGAMLPIMLAKSAPQLAVNAIESTQRMTRQMNSVQRIQTFGDAQFMDTQQLATMRQAGMELAKMSQYNLQQSMMGNEAQYMHRI